MVDREIARVAATQHGLVTAPQLRALGLTRRMVAVRLSRGSLSPIYRGVYCVGHEHSTRKARWLAAVLACGEGGVLSHRAAAAFWDIRQSSATRLDVIAPGRRGRGHPGIAVHRATGLVDADWETVDAIPVTTVARTLVDLATVVHRSALEYAIHRAESRRMVTPEKLRAVLARLPGRQGTAIVRAILDAPQHELDSKTRGPAERRFLAICHGAALPPPRVNEWIALPIASGGLEVDFHWPHTRLVVEIDERRTHQTTRALLNDPTRDRALIAAGWGVLRFAEAGLDRPEVVAATVRARLDDGPPAPWVRPPPSRRRGGAAAVTQQ